MSTVFLDTVGLIAIWDEADQWHHVADKAYRDLLSNRARLVTSVQVLLEFGNAAARRPYRTAVDDLRISMDAGGLLITPTDQDLDEAWSGYRMGQPGSAGIVDHISLRIMRRLKMTDAFTNDRHFLTAGFRPLF